MSALISIADTQIALKGKDFFASLSPIERKLIGPFIIKEGALGSGKNNYIAASVKCINNLNTIKGYKLDSELEKLIRACFFYKRHKGFERFFRNFVNGCLIPYLRGDFANQKRREELLKDSSSRSRIIIQRNAFVVFNTHNKSYELIYSKINHMLKQDKFWPYNLYALGLLFRMIFCLEKGGFMLHASALEHNGAGYVFVGPSNSGKSTVTAMLEPDRILSDDIALIRRVDDTYNLYSNPWWNVHGKVCISKPALPVPLKAIFFIEKSKKNSMEKLNYKKALSTFIYIDGCFQQAGYFNNKDGIRAFYIFAQKLIEEIPVFKLCIKKSPQFKGFFYKSIANYL